MDPQPPPMFMSQRWFLWQWMKLIFVCAGILVVLALPFAGRLKRWWQLSSAEGSLVQARDEIARQEWGAAFRHAQEILQLQPDNATALHVAADALSGLGAPPDVIVDTLRRAKAAGETSSEVDLKLARALMQRGDLAEAQKVLGVVPAAARTTWLAIDVEATLLMLQGRKPDAAAHMRRMLEAEPAAPGAAVRLAALDLENGPPSRRAAARGLLMQEAANEGPLATLAMQVLVQDRTLSAIEARDLAYLASRLPEPASDKLRSAALAVALKKDTPSGRADLLSDLAADAGRGRPENAFRFLRFLASIHEAQAMLDFIGRHRAALVRVDAPRLLHYELEALAQTRQWTLVAQKLESPAALRLEPWERSLWHACALAAADPADRQITLTLQAAFEATDHGQQTSPAGYIADTAMLLGQHGFAFTCYEVLLKNEHVAARQIALLEKARDALATSSDSAARLRIARQLAELTPGHERNAFFARYLELLLTPPGTDVPRPPPFTASASPAADALEHFLRAIIMYHRANKAGVLDELQGLEKAQPWPPGQRAVIAGLLAYAGETARAFQIAERIPKSSPLLPEEAALLQTAR